MSDLFIASRARMAITPYLSTANTPTLARGASVPNVSTTFIRLSPFSTWQIAPPCRSGGSSSPESMCPHRDGNSRSTRLGTVRTMNQSDLQVQLDLLAHDPAPGLQGLLPVEEPVQPADHGGGSEHCPFVPGRVCLLFLDPDVEADR